MNLPATFGCFCLARTKLDNYHCVRTHCVGLTLLNCYPTFLLRKELEQATQPYLFWARKQIYALRKLVLWLMFQLCPRTACPRGTPSEPLMFVWPGRKIVPLISSVRTRLNLWLTELSIMFFYFGLVRISPKCPRYYFRELFRFS